MNEVHDQEGQHIRLLQISQSTPKKITGESSRDMESRRFSTQLR
jgi:hypothetical protein